MTDHRQPSLSPSPSADEAAAIVAALERFMRETAPVPKQSSQETADGWQAAAVLDGVSRDPWEMPPDTWLGSAR